MRHANSPRRPRRLFSSRRFRHTAVSPPPCTRAMHSCRAGPVPGPPRRAVTAGRIAMRAILSHFANCAWLAPFASSREGHSLPGCRANIRGPHRSIQHTAQELRR